MSDERKVAPLEPFADPHGRIIDIGEFRIRHGRTPYKEEKMLCRHANLIVSQSERRIWCEDCQKDIEPFEVVLKFQREWGRIDAHYRSEHAKAQEALSATLIRRAAKSIDRTWGRKMAPCCPGCNIALLPEDFANGAISAVSMEYEEARRKRDGRPMPSWIKNRPTT